jgi:hypothetical protein
VFVPLLDLESQVSHPLDSPRMIGPRYLATSDGDTEEVGVRGGGFGVDFSSVGAEDEAYLCPSGGRECARNRAKNIYRGGYR